ncbi:MAG: hypothetical protein LBK98_00460 [Peptococcaceae bacterium]|jgi:tetrapyrrole methylase family protein/MazG family protein|nr:hypothetical protein [Peptococcaceae bacterium]
MATLWIAGLGPAGMGQMTLETLRLLRDCDTVILRTAIHPAAAEIGGEGIGYISCDSFYETGADFQQVYERIVDFVLEKAAGAGRVCYCVPGHPLVAEETVRLLLERGPAVGIEPRVLPGMSFLDPAFLLLGLDPARDGLMILDGPAFAAEAVERATAWSLPRLFTQVYSNLVAGELKLALLDELAPETEVVILYHVGEAGKEGKYRRPLAELDHFRHFDHLTSVFVPAGGAPGIEPNIGAAAAPKRANMYK